MPETIVLNLNVNFDFVNIMVQFIDHSWYSMNYFSLETFKPFFD